MLGERTGEIGTISDITSVVINGEPLPVNGYIDIGLIDTMDDMITCSFGTLIYCLVVKFKPELRKFSGIWPKAAA